MAREDERLWYALYTRARFEKKVTLQLSDLGIESFLPMHKVLRYWSDRKKYLQQPLFPSYVFVFANAKERYQSTTPSGVVRMISFRGQPAMIPDEQIKAVYRILQIGLEPSPFQYFAEGDKVKIREGPLEGLSGYIVQIRGKNRFLVNVDAIRQSIAVEIDSVTLGKMTSHA
jgi:transcription antitermination factor NusG